MMDSYTLPTAPDSIGRILDAGTRLFMHSFKRVLPLALAGQLVVLVPGILVMPFGEASFAAVIGALLMFVAVIAYIVLYLALVARIWTIANGKDLDFSEAWRAGYKVGVPFFLGGILYMLAVSVGFVLLLVPGLYLSLSLGLFAYLVVVEKLGALAAIKRSHELIRGEWWRTAAVITVPIVLIIAVLLVFQVAPAIFFGVDFTTGEMDTGPVLQLGVNVLGGLSNALTQPWFHAIALVLYQDLRLRKEGGDLEQRIAALATGT